MEYVLICVSLALLAVVFVLFYKNKQLESDNQQVEFEKKQSIESYQGEIAATVSNYEQQQETLKTIERKKYHELKISTKREVEQIKELKNQLVVQHNKEKNEIQKKHNNDIHMLQSLITELRSYSINSEELNTHEMLHYMKRGFVQQGIISENEFHILPNVFVPNADNRNGAQSGNSQIDHVVLFTTGIYVIETKDWNGRMIHGLTKENAGLYTFMIDEIGKYQHEQVKEETFVFVKESSSNDGTTIMRVENKGNPAYKVKNIAIALYNYFKEGSKKELKDVVKPIVYFANEAEENTNEVIDLSNESLPRFSKREQLVSYFRNERLKGTALYTAAELQEIKEVIERMNYVNA
ncbi:nuclease-related domain-containing protein [Bacillus sp. DX4.1]|uniref:nuclease-related domain-containing protein n=1 Tax=Bacillus sp. DX4.1 TaxID=3055867 RepID=UPI0025A2FC7E|nr:nuclease-related domain-containing protein [Bacillus sp. DX4.1]MDM5189323.1 nuclease-related domain-containing protein [Bacillus sp. DX4.1]